MMALKRVAWLALGESVCRQRIGLGKDEYWQGLHDGKEGVR